MSVSRSGSGETDQQEQVRPQCVVARCLLPHYLPACLPALPPQLCNCLMAHLGGGQVPQSGPLGLHDVCLLAALRHARGDPAAGGVGGQQCR